MTALNAKSYLGWIAERTVYRTQYALFENTYNGGVIQYNAQFDLAGDDKKAELDKERLKVDACKDKSDYDGGMKVLARWGKLLPEMHTFFEDKAAFADRDRTEHDDVEDKYDRQLAKIIPVNGAYKSGSGQIKAVRGRYDNEIEGLTVKGIESAFGKAQQVMDGKRGSFLQTAYIAAKDDTSEDMSARARFNEMTEVLQRFRDAQPQCKEYADAKPSLPQPVVQHMDGLKPAIPDKIVTQKDFEALESGIDALETFAELVPDVLDYADAAERADAQMRLAFNPDSLNKLSSNREKARKQRDTALTAARNLAEKTHDYANARDAMETLILQLANDQKNYVAEAKKQVATKLQGKPQAAMLAALDGKTDASGQDVTTALYEAFGADKIAELFAAADPGDLTKEVAAGNLAKLAEALGAKGIAGLGAGLAGDDKPLDGVKHAAGMMKHGMTGPPLAKLRETYDDDDELREMFATGFKGDPELLASIVGTGLGGKTDDEDCDSIGHLKTLTDAFADKKDLGKLVDGFASRDPFAPGDEKRKAGERMNKVLTNRFSNKDGIQPEKLKTPFFDTLNGLGDAQTALVNELQALNQRATAFANFQLLPKEQQDLVPNPKPADLSGKDKQRQAYLTSTVNPGYTPKPLGNLIRNAASCAVKTPGNADKSLDGVDLNGARSTPERMEHFLTRHTREHFPFGGSALAPKGTPVASADHKPATLWPEGTDAKALKGYLTAALKAVRGGIPPYDNPVGGQAIWQNDFTQRTANITVSGQRLEVKLGFERVAMGKTVRVTQFYPKKSGALDTLEFEDLHGIKQALAV